MICCCCAAEGERRHGKYWNGCPCKTCRCWPARGYCFNSLRESYFMSSTAAGRPSRGAGINTPNRFLRQQRSKSIIEGIDDWEEPSPGTIFLQEHAKTLVNKVTSPDVGMYYSMNPYQGC